MRALRRLLSGAILAAFATVGLAAPAHASSPGGDLLGEAIAALEAGDDAGYAQTVDLITVSGAWLPELGHRALRLRDVDDLQLVWLLIESTEDELYELTSSVVTLERDAIAFQPPGDDSTGSLVPRIDRQGAAVLETMDHRRLPLPVSARPVLGLLPSSDDVPPPIPAAYDLAIADLATLIDGGSVELGPVPTTTPPTTVAPPSTAEVAPTTATRPAPVEVTTVEAPADDRTSTAVVTAALLIGTLAFVVGVVFITRGRRLGRRDDAEFTDELTGLHNRRRFDNDVSREAEFGDRATAMLIVDLDLPAHPDDQRSNPLDDEILERAAATIIREVRSSDVAYRYGRRQFSVLLSATTEDQAVAVAERIRAAIIDTRPEGGHHLSASIGVASGAARDLPGVAERADDAVALAKSSGPNSVSVA